METDAELTDAALPRDPELDTLPAELRVVLGRLIRRLRREHRFPLTQAAVLGYLDRDGPAASASWPRSSRCGRSR